MVSRLTYNKKIGERHRTLTRRLFKKNGVAVVGGLIIVFIIFFAILAPHIAPYDPNDQDLTKSFQNSSATHIFGTDKQGRDIFSRIIYGSRSTLLGALLVVAISNVIGIPLGLISGYYGARLDALIMRGCDILLSFPALLLAFVIVAVFGRGFGNTVFALGIVYVPMIARLVRSVTMIEKQKTYVEAARSIGVNEASIIFKHIAINCISPILVQVTIDLAYSILDLAAMSFLGLGVQPPTADWGGMLAEGREYLMISSNVTVAAGFAIMLTVISFNLFSDGVQTYLDPKQRKI